MRQSQKNPLSGIRVLFCLQMLALACLLPGHAARAGHPSWEGDMGSSKDETPSQGPKGITYVKVDPISIPIIDDSGVQQSVTIKVIVQAADDDAAAEIKSQMPRLNDAFITNLYDILNDSVAMKNGIVQVTVVKGRLSNIAKKIFGENKVKDVLLDVVYQKAL